MAQRQGGGHRLRLVFGVLGSQSYETVRKLRPSFLVAERSTSSLIKQNNQLLDLLVLIAQAHLAS